MSFDGFDNQSINDIDGWVRLICLAPYTEFLFILITSVKASELIQFYLVDLSPGKMG